MLSLSTPQPRFRRSVVVVAMSALVAGACGSETPDFAFDAAPPPTTTVAPTTVPPPSTTAVSPDASEDEPGTTGSVTTVEEPPDRGPVTEAEWTNVTANLAGMESDCGNLGLVASPRGADYVIAAVALRGLWALDEPGADWYPLGTASGSDVIQNRPANILFDPDDPNVFWEVGNYNSDGAFRTVDAGETFTVLGDAIHLDAIGVDMSDPDRQTLLASIHEQRRVQLSLDGGMTWETLEDTLPSTIGASNVPFVVDQSTFLLGSWLTEEPGIYRSTDQGATWELVYEGHVMELALPFAMADGSILWPLHNELGIIRSTDGGTTWEPWSFAPLVVPIVDMGDGRLASATSYQVMISENDGVDWAGVGPGVPFRPWGLAYAAGQRTFYISQWDCETVVLDDAVASLTLISD